MAEVDTKRARLSLDGMVPTSEAYPVSVGAECASCDEEVERLFELKCVVQPYAWGKVGSDSLVGRLAASGQQGFVLDSNSPYAEMWMGTHPSGPSVVNDGTGATPLSEWMKLNAAPPAEPPNALGAPTGRAAKAGTLPFLFKILSVRTALSIQAHPDRTLAAQLHHAKPDKYKDDNHKPEMAVAITPFEALCSFLPAEQLLRNLQATPELAAVVSAAAVEGLAASIVLGAPQQGEPFKAALRALFEALMSAPKEVVARQLQALMARIQGASAPLDALACRLHDQYPGDVGVFCAYLLNYTTLQPGQALFLAANEPHAYISGDCAEIMANSDNVVRAGLTPKWMDIDTLCACLTYGAGTPHFVEPVADDSGAVWTYHPPTDEFMLERIEMEDGGTASLPSKRGAAIIIIVEGGAQVESLTEGADAAAKPAAQLSTGAVQLVRPRTALRVRAHGRLLMFRASAQDGPQ